MNIRGIIFYIFLIYHVLYLYDYKNSNLIYCNTLKNYSKFVSFIYLIFIFTVRGKPNQGSQKFKFIKILKYTSMMYDVENSWNESFHAFLFQYIDVLEFNKFIKFIKE